MVPAIDESLLEHMDVRRVDHLPIVSGYCKKLGLVDTINDLVPTEMEVGVGTVVQGMVLDTLSGRSPLYRLKSFLEHQDVELLLGEEVNPTAFNDTTVGRVLDEMYEVGTMKIFQAISARAIELFSLDLSHAHFDTTSVSVWGDYNLYHEEGEPKRLINCRHHCPTPCGSLGPAGRGRYP